MPDVASQTLDLVGRELNATLDEARTALETYVEQPENLALLAALRAASCTRCRACCACSRSTAPRCSPKRWSRSPRYLLDDRAERKNQAESLDALMRAMVQLPSYLERVLAAGATSRSCCCRCSTTCAPCAAARCCPKARCCC